MRWAPGTLRARATWCAGGAGRSLRAGRALGTGGPDGTDVVVPDVGRDQLFDLL